MAQLPNTNILASFTALNVDEHQSTTNTRTNTHTNNNNNNSRNALVRGNTVTNAFANSALIFGGGGGAFVGNRNSIHRNQHGRPSQEDDDDDNDSDDDNDEHDNDEDMDDVVTELSGNDIGDVNGDTDDNEAGDGATNNDDGLRLEEQADDDAMGNIGNANANNKDDGKYHNDNLGAELGEEKYNDLNYDSGFINQNNNNKPETNMNDNWGIGEVLGSLAFGEQESNKDFDFLYPLGWFPGLGIESLQVIPQQNTKLVKVVITYETGSICKCEITQPQYRILSKLLFDSKKTHKMGFN